MYANKPKINSFKYYSLEKLSGNLNTRRVLFLRRERKRRLMSSSSTAHSIITMSSTTTSLTDHKHTIVTIGELTTLSVIIISNHDPLINRQVRLWRRRHIAHTFITLLRRIIAVIVRLSPAIGRRSSALFSRTPIPLILSSLRLLIVIIRRRRCYRYIYRSGTWVQSIISIARSSSIISHILVQFVASQCHSRLQHSDLFVQMCQLFAVCVFGLRVLIIF